MRIFITGGTGFIGRRLLSGLLESGHEVTTISRNAVKAKALLGDKVSVIGGNPSEPGEWQEEVGRSDAIVNLCGEPILDQKWTEKRKQLLLNSRILPTRLIVDAISRSNRKPEVLISGSAIGYYGGRGDEKLTEDAAPGNDFAAQLCRGWEAEARKAEVFGIRVANLRTGEVLGAGGGVLAPMLGLFKFYAGGPLGSGRQYMSWIHIDDHVAITNFTLMNKNIAGPINLTGPNPVTNRDFSKALGKALGRPSWLPAPSFALRLKFGEGASLILEGQRVVPKKALDNGYKFKFANLDEALMDVLKSEES